jgi:hypothetical protein
MILKIENYRFIFHRSRLLRRCKRTWEGDKWGQTTFRKRSENVDKWGQTTFRKRSENVVCPLFMFHEALLPRGAVGGVIEGIEKL